LAKKEVLSLYNKVTTEATNKAPYGSLPPLLPPSSSFLLSHNLSSFLLPPSSFLLLLPPPSFLLLSPSYLFRRYISSHYLADSSLSQDMIGSSFFGSKRDHVIDFVARSTSDTEGPQYENITSSQFGEATGRVTDRKLDPKGVQRRKRGRGEGDELFGCRAGGPRANEKWRRDR
jgi:hypothetical protein